MWASLRCGTWKRKYEAEHASLEVTIFTNFIGLREGCPSLLVSGPGVVKTGA